MKLIELRDKINDIIEKYPSWADCERIGVVTASYPDDNSVDMDWCVDLRDICCDGHGMVAFQLVMEDDDWYLGKIRRAELKNVKYMDKLQEAIKTACHRLWITDTTDAALGKSDIESLAKEFYGIGRETAIEDTSKFLSTETDDYFDCDRKDVKNFIDAYKSRMYGKQE